MSDKLKEFKERFAFELRTESFLIKSDLKKCTCDILVNGYCIQCGRKKDAPKFDAPQLN